MTRMLVPRSNAGNGSEERSAAQVADDISVRWFTKDGKETETSRRYTTMVVQATVPMLFGVFFRLLIESVCNKSNAQYLFWIHSLLWHFPAAYSIWYVLDLRSDAATHARASTPALSHDHLPDPPILCW